MSAEIAGGRGGDGRPGAAALARSLEGLERRYGRGTVRVASLDSPPAMGTGIQALDALVPGGGLPRGRLSRLSGAPGEGAFDLSLALLARLSREFPVALVDFDRVVDPGDVADYGGDLGGCWVVRPRLPGEGWAAARALIRAGVEFCLLLAREWRPPGRSVPAALLAASEERNAAVLLGGGLDTAPDLGGRVGIEISCQRLGWMVAHGDVSGIRLRLLVTRSRLGPPGRSRQLQLGFPRPYVLRAGVEELGGETLVFPPSWERGRPRLMGVGG